MLQTPNALDRWLRWCVHSREENKTTPARAISRPVGSDAPLRCILAGHSARRFVSSSPRGVSPFHLKGNRCAADAATVPVLQHTEPCDSSRQDCAEAMHAAIRRRDLTGLQLLLRRGADPDERADEVCVYDDAFGSVCNHRPSPSVAPGKAPLFYHAAEPVVKGPVSALGLICRM